MVPCAVPSRPKRVSQETVQRTKVTFARLLAKRVELVTDELNAGSRSVAARCGFSLEGILRSTMQSPDGKLRNSCV